MVFVGFGRFGGLPSLVVAGARCLGCLVWFRVCLALLLLLYICMVGAWLFAVVVRFVFSWVVCLVFAVCCQVALGFGLAVGLVVVYLFVRGCCALFWCLFVYFVCYLVVFGLFSTAFVVGYVSCFVGGLLVAFGCVSVGLVCLRLVVLLLCCGCIGLIVICLCSWVG